jgi:hypothetical protein
MKVMAIVKKKKEEHEEQELKANQSQERLSSIKQTET